MKKSRYKTREHKKYVSVMLWFVLGNVASGKSTLCKKLASEFGYKHLALGDLLRKEENPIIQVCMRDGKLIPSNITVAVLKRALEEEKDTCKVILVDGFPRNIKNIREYNISGIEPDGVLYLECEENVCLGRLLLRKRFDDTEKCIHERFLSFKRDTLPVIEYYKEKNILYKVDNCIKALEWIKLSMIG